jgi:hypothetical protein
MSGVVGGVLGAAPKTSERYHMGHADMDEMYSDESYMEEMYNDESYMEEMDADEMYMEEMGAYNPSLYEGQRGNDENSQHDNDTDPGDPYARRLKESVRRRRFV